MKEILSQRATTITLLVLIILAAMWRSGRLQRILEIAFGTTKK